MTNTTYSAEGHRALVQALDILDDEGRLRKRATELATHIQSRKPSAEASYIAARLVENHNLQSPPPVTPAAEGEVTRLREKQLLERLGEKELDELARKPPTNNWRY